MNKPVQVSCLWLSPKHISMSGVTEDQTVEIVFLVSFFFCQPHIIGLIMLNVCIWLSIWCRKVFYDSRRNLGVQILSVVEIYRSMG